MSFVDTGISGKSAEFDGTGRIVVSAFRNWAWGSHFAVSAWFLRDPRGQGNYVGIVNNGYSTHGSCKSATLSRSACTHAHVANLQRVARYIRGNSHGP